MRQVLRDVCGARSSSRAAEDCGGIIERPNMTGRKAGAVTAGLFLLLAAISAAAAATKPRSKPYAKAKSRSLLADKQAATCSACQEGDYIFSGATPDSVFDQLTKEEYLSVAAYVADALDFIIPSGLGDFNNTSTLGSGTSGGTQTANVQGESNLDQQNLNVTLTDNYLYSVFLYPVNKAEALDHLDNGGPPPQRFAKVIAIRGGMEPPDVMEYKVGPLPLSDESTIEEQYEPGQIPWVKRPFDDIAELAILDGFEDYLMSIFKPIFFASLGQCGNDLDPDCAGNNITNFPVTAPTRENGFNRVSMMLHFYNIPQYPAAFELLNIPFMYKVDTTSQDYNDWTIFELEFCGQGFTDPDSMLQAFQNGTLYICQPFLWLTNTSDYNLPEWSLTTLDGTPREGSEKAGPRVYEPQGKRYLLFQGDSETSRVFEWLGWQGHVAINPWTGLSLHDVRFKGDRIAYELSVNDQMVAYSAYSSIGQTFYYDVYEMLGGNSFTLRPGYDCPETASYMNITMMGQFGQQFKYEGAACFFEEYTGTTSYRHFDYDDEGMPQDQGLQDYEFVIRTIATVGNYDYIYSIRFRIDGSIRCQVQAAGYLQGLYYDTESGFSAKERPFGTRVHTNSIGNLHDHLSSWKVDLDVLGTNNTFRIMTVKVGTYDDILGPGSTPMWARPTDVFKYQSDDIVESEAGYELEYKVPTTFRITNEDELNEWGSPRGYGIFHQYTVGTQLLPDTHPITKAAAWSKYHVAVTQRKDDEPTSDKPYYDVHSPGEPIWSLDMALDGEPIVGEDLVAWVSLGIIHAPRSEDVPLISNIGAEFQIRPVNYFNQLPSLDVASVDNFQSCAPQQGVLFNYNYTPDGSNRAYNKAGFKFGGPFPFGNFSFDDIATSLITNQAG